MEANIMYTDDNNAEFGAKINNIKYFVESFLMFWAWVQVSTIFRFFYYRNKDFTFVDFFNKLEEKLLKYNGYWSGSDSSSEISEAEAEAETEALEEPAPIVIKYEDKYLEDIKKMSVEYKLKWSELDIRDKKFNELYEAYKIYLLNEKHKLNSEIVEKGMKYLELGDCNGNSDENNYENISDEVNSDEFCDIKKNSLEKESKIKAAEDEINLLRSKLKELEEISDIDITTKLKKEAHDFVIKERLDALKNSFIMEKTPLGNVIMYWNNSRESFEFYSDNTIPYRYLETVGRKYVKTFNCRSVYVDMDFELSEFERKKKEKQEKELKLLEEKKKMDLELEQNTLLNSNLGSIKKKDVFAKFKNYNKESGTGKVNRGAAPPKNSIPNNNNTKNFDENVVLKENANRYTCEGRLANFSILKKPDRKVVDKKYAMSFADFKKLKLHN